MKRDDIYLVCRTIGFGRKLVFEVKVLCVSDGYAMVRRKGAVPFVASVNDLERWTATMLADLLPENSYDGRD